MSFTLKLFGGASLESDRGTVTGGAVQRHRVALLALLATTPSRGISRDKLIALLWPQRDYEHGRNLLNQAVYVLRKELGEGAIVSAGDELRLNGDIVDCDVIAFDRALDAGDDERAIGLYTGPFLDGFFITESAEFEHWVDRERDRLAAAYAEALEHLADTAEARGDNRQAAEWWRMLAGHDPYDSRIALRLMQALDADGNPAGALRHAALHEKFLRDELGIGLPSEVVMWKRGLRAETWPQIVDEQQLDDHQTHLSAPHEEERVGEGATRSADHADDLVTGAGRLAENFRITPFTSPLIYYAIAALVLGALIVAADRMQSGLKKTASSSSELPSVVVDEIARAVAREIERREQEGTTSAHPEHRTENIAAYELYLRGSDPIMLRDDRSTRQALEFFRRAVALDSTYAAAWSGVARMSFLVAGRPLGVAPDPKLWSLAEEAAGKAIALDSSLAEAHAVLALLRLLEFDFDAAETRFKRAIALEPERARFREWLVSLYLWTGRHERALAEAQRALDLDPLSSSATAELARALHANDRCDDALTLLEDLDGLDPPLLRVPTILAQCYAKQEMWSRALDVLQTSHGVGDPIILGHLGYLLARAGYRREALEIRQTLLDQWRGHNGGAFPIAVTNAGLREIDELHVWLQRALEDRSLLAGGEHFTIMAPILEEYGSDPRIQRLMAPLRIQVRG